MGNIQVLKQQSSSFKAKSDTVFLVESSMHFGYRGNFRFKIQHYIRDTGSRTGPMEHHPVASVGTYNSIEIPDSVKDRSAS